jgi:CheY-like chemotaxis protein
LEAISSIRDQPPDDPIGAALIDRAMPDADGLEVARTIAATQGAQAPPMILLAAAADRVDRAAAVGVSRMLLKPVRVSELRRVLGEVLGRVAPTAARAGTVVGEVAKADDVPTQALRVLLAEDNRVNQILARALLNKWGCEVTLVEDGVAAVQAVEAAEFGLVLMDVQMPELDGLEATERIRAWEHASGRQHARIVALTAHAMAGDEARCLAAGMDGYLTKPLRPEDLQAVVADAYRGIER